MNAYLGQRTVAAINAVLPCLRNPTHAPLAQCLVDQPMLLLGTDDSNWTAILQDITNIQKLG